MASSRDLKVFLRQLRLPLWARQRVARPEYHGLEADSLVVQPELNRKRMLVLCPFPIGVAAGQRLKYEQYFYDWSAAGYEIDVSCFMDISMWEIAYKPGRYLLKVLGVIRGTTCRILDLFCLHNYDIVYVFMWVTPFGTTVMERIVRYRSKRLIFDVEDNVLTGQSLPKSYRPNAIIKFLKGPSKANYLIRVADHVITSSPFLNSSCLRINNKKRCTYISSSIDTGRFIPANFYSNDKPVVIGWTGTVSSKIYLEMLSNVFRRLARRVPFKLKVIGNFDFELSEVDLEVVTWSADREVLDMQSIDIGVYPLPNDEWVYGKSGLKAIQYMAFGIPCVATDVGTTPLIITHRVNGMLVKTDDEWLGALEELVLNPKLRRSLGAVARSDAVEKYSTLKISELYRGVLSDTMRNSNV
jgi:glycosyltransferase involved in cell wall biosynthesis